MHEAVTAQRMKNLDRIAINRYGIPSIILMENAGRGLAKEVIKRAAMLKRRRPIVAVYCGKGNNGGDGMVCARYLFNNDINTEVFIIDDPSPIRGDTAVHLKILQKMGVAIFTIKKRQDLKRLKKRYKADIIVDAIFGIGFKGKAQGIYKDVIEFINATGAYKFSVDVPSGLDATTGDVKGPCIQADETVTMGISKTGFYRNDGPECVGRIKVVDIGMPVR